MANEMNFAETVMLVDAAYLNRVCGDLKKHKLSQKGKKLMNKRGQTQLLKGNVLWNRIT